MIAASRPGLLVGHCEQCCNFLMGQKVDLCARVMFGGDCQHTLDLSRPGRHLVGGKVKEGSDCSQPGISAARRNTPALLQVVEERADQWGTDVFECNAIR